MSVQSRYPKPLVDQRQFFDELITEKWDSYMREAWDISRQYEVPALANVIVVVFEKPA